jgi:DNA invertase Pin-like site-specific DNA recombinase
MVRAAAYARVSADDEGSILSNQLEALRDYCAAKGFELVEVFQEVASGTTDKQARLNDLLSQASKRTRSFDIVVFTSLSRMTRGGVEAALYTLHRLERSGVGWHFTEQPVLNCDSATPKLAKDIVLAVLAAIDEDYRARISRATRSAYQKRKNLAEAAGQRVRWGRPPGSKNGGKSGPSVPSGTTAPPTIVPISTAASPRLRTVRGRRTDDRATGVERGAVSERVRSRVFPAPRTGCGGADGLPHSH